MNKTKQITIAGFGGQGVMFLGQMLAHLGNEAGLNSLWYPSYGPETRGGTANCAVTLSDKKINSPIFSEANTLFILNKPSLDKFIDKVYSGGTILYNSSLIKEEVIKKDVNVYPLPINDLATELGNIRVANMIMFGAYLELNQDFSDKLVEKVLISILGEGKKDLVKINLEAIALGKEFIREMKG
ncbi:MAG: 2-oxoacid:ferredoxin oxidoreductase subunit gamma [Acholeplasmataceae bacterium]|jgi:2-oxoglutarate ferredoxin oxidoreductase subunit gamma|nr:2-oxoacid:ferredoxin oxidoreductase subunit gamma [Acholeplasmataceae bacterium]